MDQIIKLRELATEQFGVVSGKQLKSLGFGTGSIKHQVHTGRLTIVHSGVYAVGHTAIEFKGRCMAALLACDIGRSTVSHFSAAHLWGFGPTRTAPRRIDIAVWRGQPRHRQISVHRPPDLDESQCRWQGPLRVTSPARTLLDIAASEPKLLSETANEAFAKGLVSVNELEELLESFGSRRGICVLKSQIVEPGFTRSAAERLMADLIRHHSLPTAELNARVLDYEVDFLWRKEKLIVEVDGFRFHRTRLKSDRDAEKAGTLQSAGYTVIRVTWKLIRESPDTVASWIRNAMSRAAAQP